MHETECMPCKLYNRDVSMVTCDKSQFYDYNLGTNCLKIT